MSDETIRDLLRSLNKGAGKNLIFKNSIGDNVEFSKVWIWKKGEYFYKDQDFFLVKNKDEKYVAAIYGKDNFHWYTLYEERGKGYLSKALRNYVIPFLWGPNRHEIHEPFQISISRGVGPSNFKSSFCLARSLGFNIDKENEYKTNLLLCYDDFINKDVPTPFLPLCLDNESKNAILEKGQKIADLFLQIKGELEIKLGENILEDLEKMKYFKNQLEGLLWEYDTG